MSITIKRLSECSLQQLTDTWNEGFSDYYSKMTFSVEMFVNRFANEELLPSRSVVAFIDDKPVGIILNGIRTIQGKKVAWNGGTCVIPSARRHGVAKAMMDATLEIYKEEGVSLATLEAYRQNERAIALYEQKGYKVVDHLQFLEAYEVMQPIALTREYDYEIETTIPYYVSTLPFYRTDMPWQSQWSSLRAGGESIIIKENGQAVGYVIFRKTYHEDGRVKDVIMYHCGVDPQIENKEDVARFALHHVFSSDQPIARCVSFNTRVSDEWLVQLLQTSGFTTRVEQVYMTMEL